MLKYPEVQAKAWAELNDVIGKGCLPTFADRDSLPYLSAIVKETLRWEVNAPLAEVHKLRTDDVYDGYFLPAGSLVMPNSWCVRLGTSPPL